MLRQGRLIPVPPPEKALAYLATARRRRTPARPPRGASARPRRVRAGLEKVAAEYGAEEVIVVTITHDHEARRRSYELIAERWGSRRDA